MKKLTVKLALILGILLLVSSEIGCAAPAPEPLTLTPEEERLHESSKPERYMYDYFVAKFEEEDSINPPPKDAILFAGASSIQLWNTEKWFPDLTTINRGISGTKYTDVLYYADRIIIPYEPSTIVLYTGSNDIAAFKPAEMVFADIKALLIKLRQALPQTRIIVISINPSLQRWENWSIMQEANDLISNICETQQNIYFADVAEVLFDENGELRKDVFGADGLHPNEVGYELWRSVVRALIDL